MDRLEHIAKLGEFIPQGDDSFIDDHGMTNRWAERRRARNDHARLIGEELTRQRARQTNAIITPQPDHGLDRIPEDDELAEIIRIYETRLPNE